MRKAFVSVALILTLLLGCAALPAGAEVTLNKDAPIVMWLPGNGGVSGMEDGATENDNRFINAIREATGYKNLTVTIMPNDQPANTMNMMLASGDYPDVIYVNGQRDFFLRYQAEGLWAPVDEAVATYGPAIAELVTSEAWATMMGDDGQHYGIPNPLHTSYDGKLLTYAVQYRSDWLAGLGTQPPSTPEEFKAALEAIKAADPAGGGATIPYSPILTNLNFGDAGTMPTLKAAFGLWQPYAMIDGELQNTMRLYLKDFLAYMNDLYAEGLVDPEFLYQTSENRLEKFIAGKIFCFDGDVWTKKIRQTWAANGTEGDTAYLPQMENIDGTKGIAQPFPVANMYMFPKTSKYMNEAIDLINTFLTDKELEKFVNFGTEGVHFEAGENDTLVPLEPEYSKVIYKIYYRLWFKPDVWWNNAVMGDFHPEIYQYAEAVGEGYQNVNVFAYMPTSEASLNYKSACDDIMNEYVSKIIVGDKPVDAVDEMFAAMDAAGYTEIEAAYKAWYEDTGAALAESLK